MEHDILANIKAVAFDIDGTIFSSEKIIGETYVEAIIEFKKKHNAEIQIPSIGEIMVQIGKPVKQIFTELLPNLSPNERDLISNRVLELLCMKIENGEGDFYPNSRETIEKIKSQNILLFAASNGRVPYISAVLKKLGVLNLFEIILVIDQKTIFSKGEILKTYLNNYQLKPNELLMVGDRYTDEDAAHENNCSFIFCEYGHVVPNEIKKYTAKIGNISEILKIISI